jgi:hypothetical protein
LPRIAADRLSQPNACRRIEFAPGFRASPTRFEGDDEMDARHQELSISQYHANELFLILK